MLVTYIKLYKYRRFPLSHKDVFEHYFEKKLSMILGPNGAGKSSLMGELSPLPSDKNDFYPGGYKEIQIVHKGLYYRLLSDFTEKTPQYSFFLGDEDLNLSGNVSTQKELAFQHFGLVPVVQDLLTGAETFTAMSLVNRKKLFNTITHLNIDAVIDNYNKLKEQLKNQEFLLKNTTSLWMTEKHKLSDTSRLEMLRGQKEQCRTMLESLLQFRTELFQYHQCGDLNSAHQGFKQRLNAWKQVYHSAFVYLTSYPYESLARLRDDALTAISQTQTQMQHHYSRIEELDQQIYAIRLLHAQDAQNLQQQSEHLQIEKNNILLGLRYFDVLDLRPDTLSHLGILEHSLPDVLHQLPENPEKKLSKDNYHQLTEQRVSLVSELNRVLQQEVNDSKLLQELQEHQNYQCPNCQHQWLPQEVQAKLTSTQTSLKALQERKAKLQLQVQSLNPEIDTQAQYLEVFAQFASIFNATKTSFRTFWRVVLDEEVVYKSPLQVVSMARQLAMDVSGCNRLVGIAKQLKEIEDKRSLIESVGDQSLQDLLNSKTQVEEMIDADHTTIELEQRKLSDYDTAKHYYEHLGELSRLLEQARQVIYTEHTHYTVSQLIRETDDELSKLKVQMIEIDKELTSHHLVEKMAASYESQIAEIQEHVKVLTILTDELSPKNGFIAKSISRFLNVIIQSINREVAKSWDYKMVLKVINVEEDALNYRFKVVVEDKLEIDDVSSISGGMQEIINLAMKITLFKLLKLEEFPMYLDEFGVRLDTSHRSRVADIIFKMIGSQTYSQIFLITHLDLAYSDFKDTEVIELTA